MAASNKHRFSTILATVAGMALFGFIAPEYFNQKLGGHWGFTFRVSEIFVGIAVVSTIALLVLLLFRRARRNSSFWFLIGLSTIIFWLLCIFLEMVSSSPEQAVLFQQATLMFWIPSGPLLYLFAQSYVDENDLPVGKIFWIVTFITMFVLIFIGGASNLIEPNLAKNVSLYREGFESELGKYVSFVFLWVFIYDAAALGMFIRAYRKTINPLRKRQIRIFITGMSVFIVGATIFDILYPLVLPAESWLYVNTPNMTFAYTSIMALILGYGVLRYGIFQINPASLSPIILQSLSEAVIGVNKDFKIEFSNAGGVLMTGYEEQLIKGMSINSLFSAQNIRQMQDDINKAASVEYEDIDLLTSNHNSIPVSLAVSKIIDDNNDIAGYIFVAANITELKKKTIELAKEKASVERKVVERTRELSEVYARLTASVNSINVGFMMTGEKNEILLMNKPASDLLAMLAHDKKMNITEEWTLLGIQSVLADATDITADINQSRSKAKPFEFKELQLGNRFIHIFLAPVVQAGKDIGTAVVIEDITEEKVLQRSRDEFFSIASHELRTPLTLLRGNAELIRDYYKDSITSEDVMGMIADMEVSSTRLIRIVNDFLDMSSLEQGKVIIRPEDFDARALATEVMNQHAKDPAKKKITYLVTASTDTVPISTDRTRLQQILENFVSNASKFTESGTITIDLSMIADKVNFRITDTGRGMKLENQGLLFHKFQQAGSSLLTRDGEGTGLGLYISKLLAESMGGTTKLEYSKEGKGTEFSLTIPAKTPPKLLKAAQKLQRDAIAAA
jgi:two-component system phosphate regulon sensor histidine kinase PhoR